MKRIKQNRLNQLFRKCKGVKIAVVGDVMLDKYIWGRVSRISPEAPVPIVEVTNESVHLGGAANVANNIAGLGGDPILFGVVGNDPDSKILNNLMAESKFDPLGIIKDNSRPTTLKTRIIANNQHVVRADHESVEEIDAKTENNIIDRLKKIIGDLGGIVLEDYNKGVINKSLIKKVIDIANENKCPIVVDPKFNNFFEYKNVTLFKPNLLETQNALGFALDNHEKIKLAGRLLLERLECDNVLITLGAEGMFLCPAGADEVKVPTKAREIHDVSGAGDTVIGTLITMLAAGADVFESAFIANHAAGVVCGVVGIVPITPDKIIDSFKNDNGDDE